MIVSTTNINHKIKHLEPIYAIESNGQYVATGGLNGELKLWRPDTTSKISNTNNIPKYKLFKIVKKHSGAVVVLSILNEYLVSGGDDGRVNIYRDRKLIGTYNHPSDIQYVRIINNSTSNTQSMNNTCTCVSVDIDGNIFSHSVDDETVTLLNKFKLPLLENEINLANMLHSNGSLYIKTTKRIFLYKNNSIVKSVETSTGPVIEHMCSKITLCGGYLFIPLSFNNKQNSIDIYTLELERVYSLIGHVAPVEVIAVKEITMANSTGGTTENSSGFVILAFSQDKSLSIWSSFNCRPAVLIKNFTSNGPALDYVWEENSNGNGAQNSTTHPISLLVSFYDGTVRQLTLDELTDRIEPAPRIELEFSETQKQIKKEKLVQGKYEKLKEKGYKKSGKEINNVKRAKLESKEPEKTANSPNIAPEGINTVQVKKITPTGKKDSPTISIARKDDSAKENKIKRITPISSNTATNTVLSNKTDNTSPVLYSYTTDDSISISFFTPRMSPPVISEFTSILEIETGSIKIELRHEENGNKDKQSSKSKGGVNLITNRLSIFRKTPTMKTCSFLYSIVVSDLHTILYDSEYIVIYDTNGYIKIYNTMNGTLAHPVIRKGLAYLVQDNKREIVSGSLSTRGMRLLGITEGGEVVVFDIGTPNSNKNNSSVEMMPGSETAVYCFYVGPLPCMMAFSSIQSLGKTFLIKYSTGDSLVLINKQWVILERKTSNDMGLYTTEEIEEMISGYMSYLIYFKIRFNISSGNEMNPNGAAPIQQVMDKSSLEMYDRCVNLLFLFLNKIDVSNEYRIFRVFENMIEVGMKREIIQGLRILQEKEGSERIIEEIVKMTMG